MVAASSPFGLSKTAIERRINNQIPRKRHTPNPVSKNSIHATAKHVVRLKPKPTPERSSGEKTLSTVPKVKPEKRGMNRTRIVGTTGGGINQWSARRILASRSHPYRPSKTQYKVQWETTWEDESDITDLAVTEWKEAVHVGSTFEFEAQDGREWMVLKDATCLENDSEDSQWELWRAIRRNVVQELGKDLFVGLSDKEFVFATGADETEMRETLQERCPEEGILAKNVIRDAWSQTNNDPGLLEACIPFGNIKLRFLAQLDPWMYKDGEEAHEDKRVALTVAEIVRAVVPNPLEGLEDDAFSKDNTYNNFSKWREITKSLVRKVPFLLKNGTWLQLFALLILGSETLREELVSVGILVQDDWCQRAREYNMHMYYDRIVDNRSTHDIQETFLNLRDFFRELGPDKEVI